QGWTVQADQFLRQTGARADERLHHPQPHRQSQGSALVRCGWLPLQREGFDAHLAGVPAQSNRMNMTLPYSQACENNKAAILAVLKRHFSAPGTVLEIGGGTGQHALHFATQMPHLQWQSSDLPDNVGTLNLRIESAALPNLPLALALDVTQHTWPVSDVDYVFSANTLHLMPASANLHFFAGITKILRPGCILCVYGPFKYQGEFTTVSNARFDLWLKGNNPLSGIRDFETINSLAAEAGLTLIEDNAMPAN